MGRSWRGFWCTVRRDLIERRRTPPRSGAKRAMLRAGTARVGCCPANIGACRALARSEPATVTVEASQVEMPFCDWENPCDLLSGQQA